MSLVAPINDAGSSAVAAIKSYPIIAIDDDPDDLFFVSRRIRKAGLKNPLLTFSDGAEAVRHFTRLCEGLLAEAPACVIFCDIKMPNLNGFETLRWLKQQPQLAALPVYMLSGSNETRDRETARMLGAQGYLVKHPPEQSFSEIVHAAEAGLRNAAVTG